MAHRSQGLMLESLIPLVPQDDRQNFETVMGYQPFSHVRAYLRQRLLASGLGVPELALLCGYRKLDKFRRHLQGWLTASRSVPQKFLKAVGADLETLGQLARLDQEDFSRAARAAPVPEKFFAALLPGLWQALPLPPGISEAEALRQVAEFARSSNRRCCLKFSGLRTTWVWPDGAVDSRLNYPRLELTQGRLRFLSTPQSPRAGRP